MNRVSRHALPALAALVRLRTRSAVVLSAIPSTGVVLAALGPSGLRWASSHPLVSSWQRLFDASSGSGAGRLAEWKDSLQLFVERGVLGAALVLLLATLLLRDAFHTGCSRAFWQVGKNDQRRLGLYISRCIVEAHGGKTWAESTSGKGSVFQFTIPPSIPRLD